MLKTDNGVVTLEPGDALFWTTDEGASLFRVVHDVRGQVTGARGILRDGRLVVTP